MKEIKLLKEYLPLIILVPALLGGIWQIIELSSMSIAYIRFFSITQILPDGLVILILITTFAIALFWLYNLERNKNKDKISSYIFSIKKPKNYIEKNIIFLVKKDNKAKFYTNVITLILILSIDIIIYLYIFKIINDIGNTLLDFILYFMFYIVMIVLLFLHYIFFIKPFKDKFKISLFPHKDIFLIKNMFILFIIFTFAQLFHMSFLLPNDLLNLKNINTTLNNTNYEYNSIKYFNDKYIFIEHKNGDNNRSIEIIKFENLFK